MNMEEAIRWLESQRKKTPKKEPMRIKEVKSGYRGAVRAQYVEDNETVPSKSQLAEDFKVMNRISGAYTTFSTASFQTTAMVTLGSSSASPYSFNNYDLQKTIDAQRREIETLKFELQQNNKRDNPVEVREYLLHPERKIKLED